VVRKEVSRFQECGQREVDAQDIDAGEALRVFVNIVSEILRRANSATRKCASICLFCLNIRVAHFVAQ
jgi:hypothetical protein